MWPLIICLFDFSRVMPSSMMDLLFCGKLVKDFGKRTSNKIMKAIPLYLMRCIWKERKNIYFEGKELALMKLKFLYL